MFKPEKIVVFIIVFSGFFNTSKSQSVKNFLKLSRPEKCWVLTHPFKAKRAYKVSIEARHKADSLAKTPMLDKDANGGMVDAFRHAYWMARLSQTMKAKKALKLGYAHEKGNYLQYKKHKTEDGSIPDKISSDMDIFNNKIGAQIGDSLKNTPPEKLEEIIIDAILQGKMKIILKDKNGNYLDCNYNIIPTDSLKHKWINNKCLVNSNQSLIKQK